MSESQTTTTDSNPLVQTWVAVTDLRGRTYLESRWVPAPTSTPVHVTHAA
ncbi:MAG: hypothetical protein WBP61_16480 [Nocardioides sp.]